MYAVLTNNASTPGSVLHRRVFTAKIAHCDSPHLSTFRSFTLIFRPGISLTVAWLLHSVLIKTALFGRRVYLVSCQSIFRACLSQPAAQEIACGHNYNSISYELL